MQLLPVRPPLLLPVALLLLQWCESRASSVTAGVPDHLVTTGGECVRLFHSRGSIGCRSLSTTDMATLHPIASSQDLQKFISGNSHLVTSDEKYVLVMAESLVQYDVLLPRFDRIGGLFIFPDAGATNTSFDAVTPQGDGTVDGVLNPFASDKTKWNPTGNALLTKLLPFPVVMLQNASVGAEFTKRAQKNADSGSGATYKAFMNYYFGPEDMDSIKCLEFVNIYGHRSPRCDPIGGQSSWAMRGNLKSDEIVMAMAGMDATSLSHVLAPGANTAASGLVALLAAAHALKGLPDSAFDKKVVFAAFQAEKFGFVGSRKFLSDLQRFTKDPEGACAFAVEDSVSPMGKSFCTYPMLSSTEFANLKLANIMYAIAVDQVGILPKSGNFTLHVNPNANDSRSLVDAITSAPSAASVVVEGNTGSLPPTPLSSFVNDAAYGKRDLVGAVLAGYSDTFPSEKTYNSRHDEFTLLDVDAVVKAAQVLAESVFTLASSNATAAQMDKIAVDASLVRSMLLCITTDWSCDLMNDYSQYMKTTLIEYLSLSDSASPAYSVPATLYPGPIDVDGSVLVLKHSDNSMYSHFNESWSDDDFSVRLFPNAYEFFTRAFLASAMVSNATADAAASCSQSQGCADGGKGMECVYPGICATKSAFHHEASSPAIKRTATVLHYDVVDSSMPIWTEPQWASDIGSYSFPDPGATIGWVALAVGIVVTCFGVGTSFMVLKSVQKLKLM
uniref:Nicastrin n=1 Tax=Peronospora matthiolae TaxID=2874970 RepID=A0AAV1V158_9STRA